MKKNLKYILPMFLCLILLLVAIPGCNGEEEPEPATTEPEPTMPEKESILIGAARPLSGPNAAIGDAAYGPVMQMWEEKVNAAGGIYVEEYGKKLPVEFIIYDDATDVGAMVRLTEKLIL